MNYELREVVELTGFSKQKLNAWERRYQLLKRRRSNEGGRFYSNEDVYRLQLVEKCLRAGHRIGVLAKLTTAELKRASLDCAPRHDIPLDETIAAVRAVDAEFVEATLSVHFAALGPVRFAELVVSPLMHRVGRMWQEGKLSVAGEHCVSVIVRTLLGQGLRQTSRCVPDKLAIFTTPENETHELGALTAAIVAQSCRLRSIYLGPCLPICTLAETARALGASAIGISSTILSKRHAKQCLSEIAAALPSELEVWMGGAAFDAVSSEADARFQRFDDTEDYIAAVRRHCARAAKG